MARGLVTGVAGPLRAARLDKAVWVDKNWRMTFEFEDAHAVRVDYLDYH